jgi:hypothetical protein
MYFIYFTYLSHGVPKQFLTLLQSRGGRGGPGLVRHGGQCTAPIGGGTALRL